MNHSVETTQGANLSMHTSTIIKERRLYTRTNCNLPIDIDDFETTSSGTVLNLGKGGAFVQMAMVKKPEVGQELIVTIPFHNNENYLIIKARVAWTSQDGMGLSFLTQQNLN